MSGDDDLVLFTQYGDVRLTGELSERDDDIDANVHLAVSGVLRVALAASEARRMAAKLLDYADEVDRRNA